MAFNLVISRLETAFLGFKNKKNIPSEHGSPSGAVERGWFGIAPARRLSPGQLLMERADSPVCLCSTGLLIAARVSTSPTSSRSPMKAMVCGANVLNVVRSFISKT